MQLRSLIIENAVKKLILTTHQLDTLIMIFSLTFK